MDLLESGDEREGPDAAARLRGWLALTPPTWVVVVLAVALAATLAGGIAGAVQVSAGLAREAARPQVDVLPAGSSSSTVAGVARGRIELLLVNRRAVPVPVQDVQVQVEGLRVLRVEPAPDRTLGPGESRPVRISFLVPSCQALVLPGTVVVAVGAGDQVRRSRLPVYDPERREQPAQGLAFGACPASARGARAGTPTDIGLRPAGGQVLRTGDGAEGFARLEVRNGGAPVRLLSVDGQVPGVVFTPRLLRGGRTISTDGLVIVRLGFRVPDCRRLRKTGRLVLRVERFDGVQELGLRVTAEPAARQGPQVDLRVVLDACG